MGLFAAVHCGRGTPPTASAEALNGASSASGDGRSAPAPMDAREADAWTRAREGDDEDRMRLADLVGCTGLRERADDKSLRITAVRAMAHCPDFSELPWLVGVGASEGDAESLEALDAVIEQAARPRRARDPEDGDELGEGCTQLLALARDTSAARPRRVVAIRALRMLVDTGCVKTSDIPGDLDAK